jgi:hypothetical protein
MSRNRGWFRFYDRMIDSPQVLELSDAEFRLLVSLWCLASASELRGTVPFTARALQRRALPDHSTQEVEAMLAHLVGLDLLEPLAFTLPFDDGNGNGSAGYSVVRWDMHQYENPSWAPEARRQQKRNERQAQRDMSQPCRNHVASGRKTEEEEEIETDQSPVIPDGITAPAVAADAAVAVSPAAARAPALAHAAAVTATATATAAPLSPPSAPLRFASAGDPPAASLAVLREHEADPHYEAESEAGAEPPANASANATARAPASPRPPRLKPIYGEDSVPMQLARTLAAGIHRNKPDAKLPRDGLQGWARELDLMLRVDHRPREKIDAVIAYAMASSFWRRVVFSASKIREKFDVIDAQRQEDSNRGPSRLHGAGGRGYGRGPSRSAATSTVTSGAASAAAGRPGRPAISDPAYYAAAARRLGQSAAGESDGDRDRDRDDDDRGSSDGERAPGAGAVSAVQ